MVRRILSGSRYYRHSIIFRITHELLKPELNADIPFEEGYVLPVDKPLGWTSSDVVRKVKYLLRKLGHKKIKVGHAGTLDPLATGVLLVCIGKATKIAESLQSEEKEYLATIRLGATTPSYDMEHPVDETYPWEHISGQDVMDAAKSMEGEQFQIPPVYSAKLIDGKRAYQYARGGEEVEMKKALINIYSIECEDITLPDVTLRIRCGKGTYIRSIARDLGENLGSGGHLTALCRTKSGNYALGDCYRIEEITSILSPEEKIVGSE